MTIESRNARTMRSAQWAYDNAAPADDYDVTDNLTEQDYDAARQELIADGWEDPSADYVEDRAIRNYLRENADNEPAGYMERDR